MVVVLQNQIKNKKYDNSIKKIASFLLTKFNKNNEILIRVVGKKEMSYLNYKYKNINSATNVLVFKSTLTNDINNSLGDIVICLNIIVSEAKQQAKTTDDHLSHILVHGFLHLLGYDHITDSDAKIMESLEIDILRQLKIKNPYEDSD